MFKTIRKKIFPLNYLSIDLNKNDLDFYRANNYANNKYAPHSNENNEVHYSILSSNDNSDREGIYKLWYEVYCNEMSRDLIRANHFNKLLSDELEINSDIVVAKINNKVIGTLRLNDPEENNASYYYDLYELNRFPPNTVSIGTKYMVHKKYRGNYISHNLMHHAFNHLRDIGKKYFVIDCSPAVYKLFDKLGFTDDIGEKRSIYYGKVKIMKYEL